MKEIENKDVEEQNTVNTRTHAHTPTHAHTDIRGHTLGGRYLLKQIEKHVIYYFKFSKLTLFTFSEYFGGHFGEHLRIVALTS